MVTGGGTSVGCVCHLPLPQKQPGCNGSSSPSSCLRGRAVRVAETGARATLLTMACMSPWPAAVPLAGCRGVIAGVASRPARAEPGVVVPRAAPRHNQQIVANRNSISERKNPFQGAQSLLDEQDVLCPTRAGDTHQAQRGGYCSPQKDATAGTELAKQFGAA